MKSSWKLYVGVDWASREHQVCVVDPDGEILGEKRIENDGAGLLALVDWLLSLHAAPGEIAVAIETPHGPVVELLMERGFAVFAINPKQLDRFRDRFSPAGAKDDRRDAFVLASSLRTDEPCFRRLETNSAWVVELREWSRIHEDLQTESLRLINQMRDQLRRYYAAFLELGDPGEAWLLALWQRAQTPRMARRLRPKRVASLLAQHRIRRIDAKEVLAILRAEPLPVSEATVQAASSHIALLVPRIQLVNQQKQDARKHLERLLTTSSEAPDSGEVSEQRDARIVLTCPGIGILVAATLLSEAGDLLRNRDYQALRIHSGAAPVTKRSGKSCVVHMRYACNPRLRNATYHWARVAVQHDPRSKERYKALRSRGKSHGQALRTVTDRLLVMLCAMLRDQSEYRDPTRAAPQLEAA